MSEITISKKVFALLNSISSEIELSKLNEMMKEKTGCVHFFEDIQDFLSLKGNSNLLFTENNKSEYGDFQTNLNLANSVVNRIKEKNIFPKCIIEPTCGRGNFILASLSNFDTLDTIIGIEIQSQYCLQTKLNILEFYLENKNNYKPRIEIINASIFDFDFSSIKRLFENKNILILGNPPWVTNSQLGSLESNNLPLKSNRKNTKGLDAITGKGNFDIAEFITYKMIESFMNFNGNLAFLIKNSVIKNIVENQKSQIYRISDLSKGNIDSQKEFSAAVDASLFLCKLNTTPSLVCDEYDFYSRAYSKTFGWHNNKFVNDINKYKSTYLIDGKCQFEWRQGIKHDCAQVMELDKKEDYYINKKLEKVNLEPDLVYPFLKSSDLKNTMIKDIRKYTIVTQHYVGENTNYISEYPSTYAYLNKYIDLFKNRKSSIYKGKSDFSIFGIGDYSFKPYKVAISGMYKTYHFTLVTPYNDKPVMLDDTCYFIGFDNLEDAVIAHIALNSDLVRLFLNSITFSDSKRMITKDILMRIDLEKLLPLLKGEIENNKFKLFQKKYFYKKELKLNLFD